MNTEIDILVGRYQESKETDGLTASAAAIPTYYDSHPALHRSSVYI